MLGAGGAHTQTPSRRSAWVASDASARSCPASHENLRGRSRQCVCNDRRVRVRGHLPRASGKRARSACRCDAIGPPCAFIMTAGLAGVSRNRWLFCRARLEMPLRLTDPMQRCLLRQAIQTPVPLMTTMGVFERIQMSVKRDIL